MNEAATLLAVLIAGSLVVTKSVDLMREVFDKANRAPKWVWIGGAFVVGVVYCVGWQIDLTDVARQLVPALAPSPTIPIPEGGVAVITNSSPDMWASNATILGEVITGLCFGAGADFWHKILASLSAGTAAKASKAAGCCKE